MWLFPESKQTHFFSSSNAGLHYGEIEDPYETNSQVTIAPLFGAPILRSKLYMWSHGNREPTGSMALGKKHFHPF